MKSFKNILLFLLLILMVISVSCSKINKYEEAFNKGMIEAKALAKGDKSLRGKKRQEFLTSYARDYAEKHGRNKIQAKMAELRDNVKDMLEEGINVVYCFDALYVHPDHLEKTVRIMNKNAEEFALLTRV